MVAEWVENWDIAEAAAWGPQRTTPQGPEKLNRRPESWKAKGDKVQLAVSALTKLCKKKVGIFLLQLPMQL